MPDIFGPGFLGSVPLGVRRPALGATASSLGKAWWAHHIENTRKYLESALDGNVIAALAALGDLWQAVADWQALTGSPTDGLLMGEHTALAKLLVDCAAGAFPEVPGCVETAVAALRRNVEMQRSLFSKDSKTFADLFGRHVEVTGGYVTALAEGRRGDFEILFAEALRNGEELGVFTDNAILSGR